MHFGFEMQKSSASGHRDSKLIRRAVLRTLMRQPRWQYVRQQPPRRSIHGLGDQS
jgi:hypothetical protein